MKNVNSVCFVGKIEEINPIQGADKIVQAVISGWECVIQKDEFVVGENVVIATTDAVIPIELADKLGITNYLKHRKKTGQYTVKTTKLKGVYSTATIIKKAHVINDKVGEDMMKELGIEKYEEPVEQIQLASGKKVRYQKNPNFHVYHKFPNAKNAPNIFTAEDSIVITRKVHGCNARYGIVKKSKLTILDRIKKFFGKKWIEYDFVYGSHEVEKGSDSQGFYSTDVWREVGDRYRIKEKLWRYLDIFGPIGEGIILYGEVYGPGIQKYYDYSERELKLVLFDIKLDGEYVGHELFSLTASILDLPKVEVFYKGKHCNEKIKEFQHNKFISNTKVPEEGVVVKCITGDRAKIAKYINPAYLEFQSKKEDSTDFH
jgi:RNA ligase (TIGR02306 family)